MSQLYLPVQSSLFDRYQVLIALSLPSDCSDFFRQKLQSLEMDWESGMDSWRCKMCGDDMQARGGATGLCWRQHLEETAAPQMGCCCYCCRRHNTRSPLSRQKNNPCPNGDRGLKNHPLCVRFICAVLVFGNLLLLLLLGRGWWFFGSENANICGLLTGDLP